MHPVLDHSVLFQRAVRRALQNDVLNIAQSAAYSAIFALFPALIVSAALIPLLPETAPLRGEFFDFFQRVLPSDVTPLLEGYFLPGTHSAYTSTRALLLGAVVSISGASSVIATYMEGLRRAYNLPPDCWSFWQRRLRALTLVPLSLIPLTAASLLVVFGHLLALWLAGHAEPELRGTIYVAAILIRWVVTLTGSVGLTALLYKLGTPLRQRWRETLPGAMLATALWLSLTLPFGWYVTRFANYSRVYGPLGAGIALLVWLYLTSLAVICGAEFNGQLRLRREGMAVPGR